MANKDWRMFLVEGILLVLLGLLAVAAPPLIIDPAYDWFAVDFDNANEPIRAVATLFGSLLLISGTVRLVTTFVMRPAPGFWWSLLSAMLSIVLGGWLLVRSEAGPAVQFFLFIIFLILDGGATIMCALQHRRAPSGRWMLVGGILELFLATLMVMGLPFTIEWLFVMGMPGPIEWSLGLIIGINMVFGGASDLLALGVPRGAEERSLRVDA
jgi:uncharacterized membrane protein HdeD (DUF308 family)